MEQRLDEMIYQAIRKVDEEPGGGKELIMVKDKLKEALFWYREFERTRADHMKAAGHNVTKPEQI